MTTTLYLDQDDIDHLLPAAVAYAMGRGTYADDSVFDTAAYVESTRREWICLLNCALQNTGNAIGQLAQFNADGTRRPHAAKSRVRTIMLDNRVYRVAM